MRIYFTIIAIYISSFLLIVYPFIPGRFDTSGIAFSTFIQIYSGIGLITVLPATFWTYFSIMVNRKDHSSNRLIRNLWTSIKVYFSITILVLALDALIIQFISRLACIILFTWIFYFSFLIWRKISNRNQNQTTYNYLPIALAFLPVTLLLFQLIFSKPVTDWSRARVIQNSSELIEQIETHKTTYGNYPLTLNSINKDFETGVNSIEKYNYTYDVITYNLYFEQTRFFFDKFGTREFVVYNPNDNHLMMSHAVWHMLSDEHPARINQGWYATNDTGIKHWKSFMFD